MKSFHGLLRRHLRLHVILSKFGEVAGIPGSVLLLILAWRVCKPLRKIRGEHAALQWTARFGLPARSHRGGMALGLKFNKGIDVQSVTANGKMPTSLRSILRQAAKTHPVHDNFIATLRIAAFYYCSLWLRWISSIQPSICSSKRISSLGPICRHLTQLGPDIEPVVLKII